MVKIAQTNNVVQGRRMRVDTTVTETNILRAAARNILNAEHIVMRSPNSGTPQIGLCDDISLRITMATERTSSGGRDRGSTASADFSPLRVHRGSESAISHCATMIFSCFAERPDADRV
jgi:hypothetical protein